MPSTAFHTCLLVAALASHSNAQLYFNLETDQFSFDRHRGGELYDHLDHW